MEDLEAINFPYYYNLVKEGKMKRGEAADLLFGKKSNRYNKYDRYKRFLEGKPTRTEAMKRRDKKREGKAERKGYKKERYEANKETILNQQKEYYEANKETILNRLKERYEAKVQQEIDRIKHNYTNLLYPHCGTQYGIIYKVQNIKNGKTYIGQTTKSFNLRYDGDFFTNKMKEVKNEELKADFYQDLETFGVGAFMVQEVIDVAFSPMELDEKEVYWIDYYKAYEEGYNSNRGFYNGRTTVYDKWIEEHPEYEEYKNIFGVYLLEE